MSTPQKQPPKLIEFDFNGDMTILVSGKPVKLTITVGQVERMQEIIAAQSKEAKAAREQNPDDGPESWMVRMVQNDYQALEVILNPDPDKPQFPGVDIPGLVPVNHSRQIVRAWMRHMLYDPGAPKDPR